MDKIEEEEVGGTNQIDPFVQPPILEVLFKMLSMEDLANYRLVNKTWYGQSFSTWRSKATLQLHSEGIVSTQDDGSIRTTSFGELVDLWRAGQWDSCPFRKFKLHCWTFKARNVEPDRFLELMASHITSLTLERCAYLGRDNFRRMIYQTFPNLQFLKMSFWYTWKDDGRHDKPEEEILEYKEPAYGVHGLKSLEVYLGPPDSMMNMLSHFHKIESLSMTPEPFEYRNLLEVIRLIKEQDGRKLPLKNFDVRFVFKLGQHTDAYIGLLRLHEQLKLPLQSLRICFERDVENNFNNEDVIKDIVQCVSSTLKNLELGDGPTGFCKAFPFGICLGDLEELRISSFCFTDFNFLKYTPKLRVLDFERVYQTLSESNKLFSNSSELEIGDWALPTLTELRCVELPLSVCNLEKLMKWMPNVENLRLRLDDVKFSMVCKYWKYLRDLTDYGEDLTDKGVIGIENGDDESPNISKLKNLTSFRTRSSNLTSASIQDGFLKLANLKELILGRVPNLDDKAKAAVECRKIRLL